MCMRSKLLESDKRFMPLYRQRSFRARERILLKYVEKSTWYTNMNLGDQFRNDWKYRITNRGRKKKKRV